MFAITFVLQRYLKLLDKILTLSYSYKILDFFLNYMFS